MSNKTYECKRKKNNNCVLNKQQKQTTAHFFQFFSERMIMIDSRSLEKEIPTTPYSQKIKLTLNFFFFHFVRFAQFVGITFNDKKITFFLHSIYYDRILLAKLRLYFVQILQINDISFVIKWRRQQSRRPCLITSL